MSRPYTGRFAPSPTGPPHFGSLVAALGSWLDARAHAGRWLVRMEDLDATRCSQAHADAILRALEDYGLTWDGPIAYQSRRLKAYEAALGQLVAARLAYPCACSRKEIADSALENIEGPVYPGTCRAGLHGRTARAWRVRTDDAPVCFDDRRLGRQCQRLESEVGDFVVKRADGLFAYQLAVVVDDAWQGVSDVVRGADLLGSTTRQIHLQRLLNLVTPRYCHLPVALNASGQKLSKQTRASALPLPASPALLAQALEFLGLPVAQELRGAPCPAILSWAVGHWTLPSPPARTRPRPSTA